MSNRTFIQRSFQKISEAANSKAIRRGVLAALIAGTSLNAFTGIQASEVQPGGISILVHEFQPESTPATKPVETAKTQIAASEAVEQIASLGTHDSIAFVPRTNEVVELDWNDEADPLELADASELLAFESAELGEVVEHKVVEHKVVEPKVVEPEVWETEKRSSQFDRTIAAAVAASAAKLGISIEQVLEPFAMIGPIADQGPATVPIDLVASIRAVIADDARENDLIEDVTREAEPTNQQLAEAVALNRWWLDSETVAVATAGSAVIAHAVAEPAEIAESIESIEGDEKLVGSSPMIVTIQDAYMPYDLAQRDLELNFLPLTTVVPISPQNYVESSAQEAVPPAIEVIATVEKSDEANTDASPERLVSDFIRDASELADTTQIRDMTFAGLGESFGDWVASLSPKRAALAKEVAPAVVVGSAVLAATQVAEVPASAPESTVVAADLAGEEVAIDVADLAMMEVNGVAIPAPVADPIPNAEKALEIANTDSVPVMEVDGKIVPAPVADPAPNASDVADQLAVMEVDGKVIPAPVADPLPNSEPEQMASSKADSDDMAAAAPVAVETVADQADVAELANVQLGTPIVVASEAGIESEANAADLIATIKQWQREATNAILAFSAEASSEAANQSSADDVKADVASPEASEALVELAAKTEAPSETLVR